MCSSRLRNEKVLIGILDQPSPSCKAFSLKSSLFMNVYNFRTWIHTILKKDGVESAQTAESESSEESELCTDTTDMRGTGSGQQRYCYSLLLIEIAALILLLLR